MKIADLSLQENKMLLQENILQLFIQILYANESVNINQSSVQLTQANYDRGEILCKEGEISKVDLAQLQSQASDCQYQMVTAQSTLRNYKLQLKQLLELDDEKEMNLLLPSISEEEILQPLPNQSEVYLQALTSRPEIQSKKINIENSKLNIASARAGYYPSISLSASIGSTSNSSSPNSWKKQLKLGWNNALGINISVPILDNRQNKNNVKKALLQYDDSQLDLTKQEKELYKTLEEIWLNAHNAQQQYIASKSKLQSCLSSYEMVKEQFTLGMKNTVELLTEQTQLLNAQQQQVQAKYMAILNRSLLTFYAQQIIQL